MQGSFFLQIPPTGPCSNPLSRRAPSCPYPLKRAHYLLCPPALFLFSILTASCCYFWSHPLEGMLHHPVLFTIGETGGLWSLAPAAGSGADPWAWLPVGRSRLLWETLGEIPAVSGLSRTLTPTYAVFLSSWELIAMCPVHCSYARCRSLSVAPSQTHGKGKKGT